MRSGTITETNHSWLTCVCRWDECRQWGIRHQPSLWWCPTPTCSPSTTSFRWTTPTSPWWTTTSSPSSTTTTATTTAATTTTTTTNVTRQLFVRDSSTEDVAERSCLLCYLKADCFIPFLVNSAWLSDLDYWGTCSFLTMLLFSESWSVWPLHLQKKHKLNIQI